MKNPNMNRAAAAAVLLALLLSLVSCGAPQDTPTAEPSVVPPEEISAQPSVEPSTEPITESSSDSLPDTPGLEESIRRKWAEDDPDVRELDYYLRRLPYELLFARSMPDSEHPENEVGGADYLLRLTGDERLYEIAALRPWYDEEGIINDSGAWRAGPNGAGVDIETAEALAAFIAAHPEFLPVTAAVLGEPVSLVAVDSTVIVYLQAHTPQQDYLGEDFPDLQVFVAIPIAAASPAYSGAYQPILYNEGFGWSTLEG